MLVFFMMLSSAMGEQQNSWELVPHNSSEKKCSPEKWEEKLFSLREEAAAKKMGVKKGSSWAQDKAPFQFGKQTPYHHHHHQASSSV